MITARRTLINALTPATPAWPRRFDILDILPRLKVGIPTTPKGA
jgi:hypothetical protein